MAASKSLIQLIHDEYGKKNASLVPVKLPKPSPEPLPDSAYSIMDGEFSWCPFLSAGRCGGDGGSSGSWKGADFFRALYILVGSGNFGDVKLGDYIVGGKGGKDSIAEHAELHVLGPLYVYSFCPSRGGGEGGEVREGGVQISTVGVREGQASPCASQVDGFSRQQFIDMGLTGEEKYFPMGYYGRLPLERGKLIYIPIDQAASCTYILPLSKVDYSPLRRCTGWPWEGDGDDSDAQAYLTSFFLRCVQILRDSSTGYKDKKLYDKLHRERRRRGPASGSGRATPQGLDAAAAPGRRPLAPAGGMDPGREGVGGGPSHGQDAATAKGCRPLAPAAGKRSKRVVTAEEVVGTTQEEASEGARRCAHSHLLQNGDHIGVLLYSCGCKCSFCPPVAFAIGRLAEGRTVTAVRPFRCGRPCSFLVCLQLRLRLFAWPCCARRQRYARFAVAARVRSWSFCSCVCA